MEIDHVELRPATEDDLPVIERLQSDPRVCAPFLWQGWHDPHRLRRQWERDGLLGDDSARLVVACGKEVLGFVAYRAVPTVGGASCWNIGISLLPEAREHGAGTRAQRLLAEHLFAHTLTNRVEAGTEVDNVAEQRALEKAGFTREGVLRGYGFRGGRHRDYVLYSILRSDLDIETRA